MLWARVFFCFSKVTFKATAKGKGRLAVSIVGDVWLHALFFTLLAVSVGVAVWQLVAGADPLSPLLISVLWATYAAVPPALLLLYALLGPGLPLAVACKFCMLLSTGASVAAVGLLWAIKDFKPQQGAGGIINSQTIGLVFRSFGKKVSQTLAPPPTLDPKWWAPHTGYTLAKMGMSFVTLGLAAEFGPQGVAVNALWPRTIIATDAINMIPGVDVAGCRTPEILADAAHAVLTRDAAGFSGQFLLDDEVLAAAGITDLSGYAVDPSRPLLPDLFLE